MPKICRKLALLLGLCVCAARLPAATNAQFTVDVWTSDEGLPQNAVIAVTQTRDGYLWLGTLNGLVRFDGHRFTTYDEANTPGLNSSRIIKLFEDSRGRLWVGTETAGVVLVKDGKVMGIPGMAGGRESRLLSICEDAQGTVWLYLANGLLGRYRDGKGSWMQSGRDYPGRYGVVMPDDSGRIWIGTDMSLTVRPLPDGTDAPLPAGQSVPVGKLDYLLPSKQGGYWRLASGRIEKWNADRRVSILGTYPWKAWLTPVNAACEDNEGNLVVGTGGEGIFWFDAQGKYGKLVNSVSGLSHNTVLSVCVDREGDLWVGTDGGGLDRVKRQVFTTVEGTAGSTVQSVTPDGAGGLWIGYFGDQVDHLAGGRLRRYSRNEGLVELAVKSLLQDREGRLWAGTYRGGLLQLRDDRFQPALGLDYIGRDSEISALFQDRAGAIWVGAQTGLARWTGREWKLLTAQDGLPASTVRAIAEDKEGTLWIGMEGGGLARMRNGQITLFGRINGLPSNNVRALAVDAAGTLWIGTSSGLASYANGKWVSFADRMGSSRINAGYLLDDGAGCLWIGSNSGLLRARIKDLNDCAAGQIDWVPVRSYGKPDGLPTRECSQGSQPAACRTADGTLWFPTIRGLVSVNPAILSRNTNLPPVIIETVKVDGVAQGDNSLRSPPPKAVTLPAGKESLEIEFASISLSAPDMGRFRYRMEGLESGWTEAAAAVRSVRYSKIPPGSYQFQVTACNEDGVWNQQGSMLAVTILPPFWRTWWFISAASLCLLASIVGGVHYVSTQKLQRQLAVLRQHEALERERARIARDLHDQLGANLTQVTLLGEMAESDKDLPSEVESHARQICNTARETTRALDEIVWTVNPSNDTLDGLINYVCKYAQEYLALAGLRYRLDVPPHLPTTPISPELRHNVFLAAKEAVNNVVKHSKASAAWLRLELAPGRFILEIEDNGRGLTPADEKKGRNGLRNMRKRLEDVGGSLETGPGAEGGLRIRLLAPLTAESARPGGTPAA